MTEEEGQGKGRSREVSVRVELWDNIRMFMDGETSSHRCISCLLWGDTCTL